MNQLGHIYKWNSHSRHFVFPALFPTGFRNVVWTAAALRETSRDIISIAARGIVLYLLLACVFTGMLFGQEGDLLRQPWPELPNMVMLGPVSCRADFPLVEIEEVQQDIARLQTDLIRYLGIPEPQEGIILCLFNTQQAYCDFVKRKYPMAPLDRPALYIKAGGPGVLLIQRDKDMLLNIRHEMTHAYLNAALRNIPIWLDEGLAKYFETPQGQRGFDNPFLQSVQKSASRLFGRAPSLERLEKLQMIHQMGEREYRESWAWVHFLIHESPLSQKLLAFYLRSLTPEKQYGISMEQSFINQKKTPLTKLLEEFLPDYRKDFVEHFKNWKP
ncbi:MAG: DUF1570 domain-containing protein [Thermoguttaceae bacterium]|nr:DUF1570 domain-containing protein [Thermoguttaceae bacterium]